MTCQLYLFILKSYIPQPHLPCHCYKLFFVLPHRYYNLIFLIPIWLPITINSFWKRSPTHHMWAEQALCFDFWLTSKNYLQTNAFVNLVVMERGEYPHTLQRKAIGRRAMRKVERETAGWTRPDLTLGTSISASTSPFGRQSYIATDVLW